MGHERSLFSVKDLLVTSRMYLKTQLVVLKVSSKFGGWEICAFEKMTETNRETGTEAKLVKRLKRSKVRENFTLDFTILNTIQNLFMSSVGSNISYVLVCFEDTLLITQMNF